MWSTTPSADRCTTVADRTPITPLCFATATRCPSSALLPPGPRGSGCIGEVAAPLPACRLRHLCPPTARGPAAPTACRRRRALTAHPPAQWSEPAFRAMGWAGRLLVVGFAAGGQVRPAPSHHKVA